MNFTTHLSSTIHTDHTPISATFSPPLRKTEHKQTEQIRVHNVKDKIWNKWTAATEDHLSQMFSTSHQTATATNIDLHCKQFTDILLQQASQILPKKDTVYTSLYTYALQDNEEHHSAKEAVNHEWVQWKQGTVPTKDGYYNAIKRMKIIRNSIVQRQQEKQWKIVEEKIRQNPSHIYKLLRKVGKQYVLRWQFGVTLRTSVRDDLWWQQSIYSRSYL